MGLGWDGLGLRLNRLQRPRDAVFRADFDLHIRQPPRFVNHKMAADHADVLDAVQALFAPHPVGFRHGVVGIRQQNEGQIVFRLEFLVRPEAIRADAQHHGVALFNLWEYIPEAASLRGAAGRLVFGIEIEDDAFAAEVRELHGRAAVAHQFKIRGEVANLERGHMCVGCDRLTVGITRAGR